MGQKSPTWIWLIMICYIVPWWPSLLSDQIAFSNSESGVVCSKIATILDTGPEQFSNSKSPCHPDASHQVSAQNDFLFGRRCGLKNFKMAASLDIGTE